jgi:Tfp pilus assembly protein PilF
MAIRFHCQTASCRKLLELSDSAAGRYLRCPVCDTVQQVPSPGPEVEPTDLAPSGPGHGIQTGPSPGRDSSQAGGSLEDRWADHTEERRRSRSFPWEHPPRGFDSGFLDPMTERAWEKRDIRTDGVKRWSGVLWAVGLVLGAVLLVGLAVGWRGWRGWLRSPRAAIDQYNRGVALQEAGQLDQAIAAYREAIRLDPDLSMAHNNLGVALSDKGQLDEAMPLYRKAIQLDANNALPHFNLGRLLQQKGQFDEALDAYREAIRRDPSRADAHFLLGVILHEKGQTDEALAAYQKAIEHDPQLAGAHWNIGAILAEKGQFDEAKAAFDKARKIDPDIENKL